ncbi:MAG: hypothetical protein M1503_11500 [Thaumarchaeota archaeon]|nr:hypothetical protein [Nitrososphaerota archaeon]MCL5318868.1 hypothetical protein [Nitrososphaerota archaeon]
MVRVYQGSAPMEITARRPPTTDHSIAYKIQQTGVTEQPFHKMTPNFVAVILAKSTNTGIIYKGGSDVTDANGLPLSAGDVYNNYWVEDLQSLYVYGTAGDIVIISWQGY